MSSTAVSFRTSTCPCFVFHLWKRHPLSKRPANVHSPITDSYHGNCVCVCPCVCVHVRVCVCVVLPPVVLSGQSPSVFCCCIKSDWRLCSLKNKGIEKHHANVLCVLCVLACAFRPKTRDRGRLSQLFKWHSIHQLNMQTGATGHRPNNKPASTEDGRTPH